MRNWNFDGDRLTRYVDFRGESLLELFGDFLKCRVQVAADHSWLSSAINQVFENLYVKTTAETDDVKFRVDTVERVL